MALNKEQLEMAISGIMTDMRSKDKLVDNEFANRLATAIEAYIKTATVTATGVGNSGVPVQSTGTLT